MRWPWALALFVLLVGPVVAATYVVDPQVPGASDDNPGSPKQPWKTLARAGAAKELRPGDTVVVAGGTYREHFAIRVSGEPGQPITFAAAPGARVVIKGSEIVRGPWRKLSAEPGLKEPYPNAFTSVWMVKLGDEFFTDPDFAASYRDRNRRWVSQVIRQDHEPLQRIGDDPIYPNTPYAKLRQVGRGLADLIDGSFYFDAATQTLYVRLEGEPGWFCIEVGVRGWVLTLNQVHDVVVRGFEARHNRQPGGQWPMASVGGCERVVIEQCSFELADFCGLGLGRSRACTVRDCDLVNNGNTGLGMGQCEECVIEDCRLLANNYRRFHPGWHCGGMKCIPENKRCVVRRCEAAYNLNSDGIWFDAANEQIRIVDNVAHHNDSCGIFYEINPGGGVIANNLVYGNRGRGIYISGSQKTWVVHNTVAANGAGIVAMPREDPFKLAEVMIYGNLLIGNYLAAQGPPRGCDLTLFMGVDPQRNQRTVLNCHSDYNVFSNAAWQPTVREHWNPDNTLETWQRRFGEDRHSRLLPVSMRLRGYGFELLPSKELAGAVPLPDACPWREGREVGASRQRWP